MSSAAEKSNPMMMLSSRLQASIEGMYFMMNGVMHSKGYYQVVGQAGVMFSYDMHCSSIEGGAPSLRRWWALRICALPCNFVALQPHWSEMHD